MGVGVNRVMSVAQVSVLLLCVWFALLSPTLAGTSDCSSKLDTPKTQGIDHPILVLMERSPWAMVLGAESPRFALYDSGLAIYQTRNGFRQILLDKQQASDLRKSVDAGALACLDKYYSTTDMTDQPSERLFFGLGGRLSSISVDGSFPDSDEQTKLPLALVSAYQRLATFTDSKAQPWMPEYIEVMIWPYEYAPDPSIHWPSKWPGLNDLRTVKRHEGYSLYLPSNDYDELLAFLKTEYEKGAVEIDGKKWAVDIRFPFPQESSWQIKANVPE